MGSRVGKVTGEAYIIGHRELEDFPEGVYRILATNWILLSVTNVVVGREEHLNPTTDWSAHGLNSEAGTARQPIRSSLRRLGPMMYSVKPQPHLDTVVGLGSLGEGGDWPGERLDPAFRIS